MSSDRSNKKHNISYQNRHHNDLVPPLVQFKAEKSNKKSPISSLNDSVVRSQYLYDSTEKLFQPNRFQE